jgi:hypothetical protein
MAKRLDHDDAMELAVQLTCSYLSSSHSASTDAEDLIISYYRQIRNVENRLAGEFATASEDEEEEEEEEPEARSVAPV